MSDAVIVGIVAATPPTLLAMAALVSSFRNGRAVKDVHVLFNSRMDQFLKVTKESAHAEGVKEEKEKQTKG